MTDQSFTLKYVIDSICGDVSGKSKLEECLRKRVSTSDVMPAIIDQIRVLRPSYEIDPDYVVKLNDIVESGRGIPLVCDMAYQVAKDTYNTDQNSARQIYRGLILKEVKLQQKYISHLTNGILEAIGLNEHASEIVKGINTSFEHKVKLGNMKTPRPKDFEAVINDIRERAEKLYETGISYIANWITKKNLNATDS